MKDIENASRVVKAIEKVEVLARPPSGLVGFKWRETRTMFEKSATEVMWITDAVEGSRYETRAESHGMVHTSRVVLEDAPGGTRLSMDFAGEAQTFGAKVMGVVFGLFHEGHDTEGPGGGPRRPQGGRGSAGVRVTPSLRVRGRPRRAVSSRAWLP